MPDPIDISENEHREAEELLPWYATGQLEADERRKVEEHLDSCGHCRRQLGEEKRMIEGFHALEPQIEAGWSRMRARIAAERQPRPFTRAANDAWTILRRPSVAMLAAAQFAFLLLAAGLMLSLSRPSYQALGSGTAPASANAIVMFKPDATERQMRQALEASGATLVGGPTDADAYLLHVEASARDSALARLRANHQVDLAQPIDRSTGG